MHTTKFLKNLASLSVLAALLPMSVFAQTTTTPKKPTARKTGVAKKTTPAADQMKLPASIPAAPGKLQTLYAMQYVDVKVGTGQPALPGEFYKVHYTGWLHDGTKFDSSVDRGQPFEFRQGRHNVITGWDEGFDGMKVGGKRRMFIPYQLAYGAAGRPGIPPKADLIFDIELIDVRDPNAPTPPASAPPQQ